MNKAFRAGYIELWRDGQGVHSNLPKRRYGVTSHSPERYRVGLRRIRTCGTGGPNTNRLWNT